MLHNSLPPHVTEIQEMKRLLMAEQPELEAVETAVDELLKEFSVTTFTERTAQLWEKLVGLSPAPAWRIERRRERVRGRLLANTSTSVGTLKAVVESLAGTAVEIVEEPDAYRARIRFVGSYGISPYIDDVKAEVEQIRPFHVRILYEFIYWMWQQLAALTWTEAAVYSWDYIYNGRVS